MTDKIVALLLVICAAFMEALGQLSLKNSAGPALGKRQKITWLCTGVSLMALEAVVYTNVLRVLDVSVAYPMGSLSFVFVTVLSGLFLKERIARERWLGVSLILGGTALLGISH